MPSWEGFKTWFEYEVLIWSVVLSLAVLLWFGRTLFEFIDRSALISTGQFLMYASATAVLSSVVLAWWIGRESRQSR